MSETVTPPRISVRVRLFASYREAAGTTKLLETLPEGAHVRDLVDMLSERLPALRRTHGLIAVNHEYVSDDAVLKEGDEVALIPPVSGGS